MSIAPVSSFPPERSESPTSQSGSPSHAPASPNTRGEAPAAASQPTREISARTNASAADQVPQDVVEVHQDPELRDQLIIQYLDKSKDVVLQVPSSQELSVERGIAQEFQQAAKLRESAPAPLIDGRKAHGD